MTPTAFRDRSLFAALTAGLVLAPLAFGGATGWFTDIFAVIAGALAMFWAATLHSNHVRVEQLRPIAKPIVLYGLVVLWCFFQAAVPVSESIAHEAWRDAAALLNQTVSPVLSLHPEASVAGALRLSGYGIVFILSFYFALNEVRALRLLTIIAISGGVYALYGIVLEATASAYVLWYKRTFEIGNLSSTFPNRNAFASYATLCLLSGCMVLYRRRIRLEDTAKGWRQAVVVIARYYFRRNGWFLYVGAALFTAILLTHSRAGLATSILAFALFAACAAHGARMKSTAAAGSTLIAFCAIVLVWMLGGATAERFDRIQTASSERIEIYRLTAMAISDRPLLGTGLGTFPDVFPAYRTAELQANINFAHNSFLENALEMGLPAAIVFYGALAMLFGTFVRALTGKTADYPYPALGIAVTGAAFFHSLFDYAIQFPAVAICFAALLGVAAAQSSPAATHNASASQAPDRRAQ